MRNNSEGGNKILAPPTARWEGEKCRFAVKRKHSETFCECCVWLRTWCLSRSKTALDIFAILKRVTRSKWVDYHQTRYSLIILDIVGVQLKTEYQRSGCNQGVAQRSFA